ncbi:hypothetical protein ABIF65_005638 [Bradyrhizobium japonicum]|jgi:hypothetical protein|nr:hypothetical protein [Bradyrhizobium japonicum]MCP1782268.1 hypothetical protein [Bradyrhizobium japonicum]MCP1861686.1 hypothetical protein [Bradyrhizobium japonicum]MCP1892445.1 hypothetical protein [Bradyrhizobium japonicum]MCP1965443.1 hypothetical protein [Bradyrhizobium japonicum]
MTPVDGKTVLEDGYTIQPCKPDDETEIPVPPPAVP